MQRSLHYLHEAREGLAEQDGPLCVTARRFRNSRGEVDTPVVQSGSSAEPGVGPRVEVFPGGGEEDTLKEASTPPPPPFSSGVPEAMSGVR